MKTLAKNIDTILFEARKEVMKDMIIPNEIKDNISIKEGKIILKFAKEKNANVYMVENCLSCPFFKNKCNINENLSYDKSEKWIGKKIHKHCPLKEGGFNVITKESYSVKT